MRITYRLPRPFLLGLYVVCACTPTGANGQAAQEIPPPLELFAAGTLSTNGGEAFPVLSRDGRTLYFATHERGWTGFHLVESHFAEGRWTRPRPVSFDTPHNDRAPFLSPDGQRLFFSSDRPLPGEGAAIAGDFNLWYVTREGGERWSEPRPVAGVNSAADDFHCAVTSEGTLYFSSNRPGGYGQYDLYRAEWTPDGYADPTNLGPRINTPGEETDVYVSPDETFLIVVATDREGGIGGDDLWFGVRRGNSWSALVNPGEPVNSSSYEYGAFLSFDGGALYFTTHRRGLGDLVRVEIDEVPALAGLMERK